MIVLWDGNACARGKCIITSGLTILCLLKVRSRGVLSHRECARVRAFKAKCVFFAMIKFLRKCMHLDAQMSPLWDQKMNLLFSLTIFIQAARLSLDARDGSSEMRAFWDVCLLES